MIKKITFCSMYVALVLLMSFVPYIGFITIGSVAITIIPAVVVVATLHMGFLGAISSSLTMGIGSLGASYVFGDPLVFFYFPDISVLPRVLMGLGVYLLSRIMGKMNVLKATILGVLGTFMHTALVTGALYFHTTFIQSLPFLDGIGFKGWVSLILLNSIVEMSVTGIVAFFAWPLIVFLRKRYSPEKNNYIEW